VKIFFNRFLGENYKNPSFFKHFLKQMFAAFHRFLYKKLESHQNKVDSSELLAFEVPKELNEKD